MIEKYEFGKIIINGGEYRSDLIIYPDRIDNNWWRDRGHSLSINDLKSIIEFQPDIIIVGTGFHGAMDVPLETQNWVKSQGVELIVQKTEEACSTYNQLAKFYKAVGAFHLTC